MKKLLYLFIVFLFLHPLCAQNPSAPKLVVGIVVDQMRNDYIYRYWNRYGNGGFKRLVQEGFYFKNAHYNYIPTYTGPGHSSIYTGATPRTHGIIGNGWYNKFNNGATLCVADTNVKPVGTDNKKARVSPHNLLSTTIGDEMKMSSGNRSKVFGIAIKDRSAVLPAGHAANGAFYMDEKNGDFVSSTWYMNELPGWMKDFNAKKKAKAWLESGWNTLYPIDTYSSSLADNSPYEELLEPLKKQPVFPYSYKEALDKNYFTAVVSSPYGNSITKEAAIACLVNEQLGRDNAPDLLAISFSSPDYIAHSFGPRSVEIEDIYLRLDKELEDLLNTLDKEVGKGNYTVFLTADHGGADVPQHLTDNHIPSGNFGDGRLDRAVSSYFQRTYNDTGLIASISNEQIFLSETKISALKLSLRDVEQQLCNYLVTIKGVAEAYPSEVIKNGAFVKNDLKTLLQNGYNHKLSGNVCFVYNPGWMDHGDKGATHGAGYNYDTHIPVIFFGAGIKKGESYSYTTITQIAPTVCELLRINQPNSTLADPLNSFFK